MQEIVLKPITYRQQECIGIFYNSSESINNLVKRIKAVKWSQVHRCWYLPLNQASYDKLNNALKETAKLETTLLSGYLQKRKEINETAQSVGKTSNVKPAGPGSQILKLSADNLKAFEVFVEHLKLRAYSSSTINTYKNEFIQLLKILKKKAVTALSVDDLRRYFVYCLEELKLTEHTMHSRINAVKFYFEQVLQWERFLWDIPRPKKPQQLPRLFSQQEIAAIINSMQNKKHKAMVMLAYGSGLRVSEVVALRTYHIDSKRMTIFIQSAKAKKDRLVSLSPVLLVMLREYAQEYKPLRKGFLFEGNLKGSSYSTRSLQEVLQAAKKKAGVMRPGGVHSLRHSFATHLIEKGTDVTMIQKLLGHNNIKTTLIYLHTSNRDLLKVISPLDDLALF